MFRDILKSQFYILLAAIVFIGAGQLMADPGEMDTLRVDSVSAIPGRVVTLPITFFNDEALSAVEFVLDYNNDYLTVDSCSLEGGRLDYIHENNVIFLDSANLIHLVVMDWVNYIGRGDGLLCNMYFTVSDAAGGQTFVISNGEWPFGQVDTYTTRFADSTAGSFIYPYFETGSITVIDIPPFPDSVWVDRKTSAPGQTVAINIYGFNELPVSEIKLALEYSSDNLIYNDTAFDGTRGASAKRRLVDLRSELNQILITLEFDEASPLPAGSGPLATILFDVDGSAPDELVFIDSTRFLDSQPVEFTLTPADDNISFTPFFSYGYVDIQSGTDVEEDHNSILPQNYALMQNIPNPFNPTTSINFELPREAFVHLNVFNILGRKVRNLVDGSLPAGRHQVIFDGKNESGGDLASGVYFYRLETDDFNHSRKMMLLK